MNEFKSPEQFAESKEKFGRNVEVHGRFVQHGEKETSISSSETGLTREGEEKSIKFGSELDQMTAIKGFSSDTERTKGTVKLIVDSSPTEKKMVQRVRHDLGFRYSKDYANRVSLLKKKILGNDFEQQSDQEKKRRLELCDEEQMNLYLNYKEKRPDKGTYSPIETAATVARRADLYIRMSDRLPSGSKVDLANGSHDYPITAFLSEVIIRDVGGKKVRGFRSVEEIGGPVKFNEEFDIVTRLDESGNKTVKMLFRGQEYDIDLKRLQELVEIAKKLEQEEKSQTK